MKTKSLIITVCGIALLTAATIQAQPAPPEFAIRWQYLDPDKSEDWSSAGAFEAQLRFWNRGPVAVALAIGVNQWNARDEFYEEADEYGYMSMSVGGSLTAVPVGISLLHKAEIDDGFALLLEAGFRYVFCESDITVETQLDDAYGRDVYRDPIRMDNTTLGVVSATLQANVARRVAIHGGVGYQWDLVQPREEFLGDDIGPTSLSATTFNFGFAWTF